MSNLIIFEPVWVDFFARRVNLDTSHSNCRFPQNRRICPFLYGEHHLSKEKFLHLEYFFI